MRRFALVVIADIAITALFAQQALAQNPHLKGGNPVSFTDNGLTLTGTVSYAGLGNFGTLQNLAATANPTGDCVNPGTGSIGRQATTLRQSR
jgi:hypothetical protein